MLVAATAMPEDVGSDRLADGRKIGTMIRGSNINEEEEEVKRCLIIRKKDQNYPVMERNGTGEQRRSRGGFSVCLLSWFSPL